MPGIEQWWLEKPIIKDPMDTDYYKITGDQPVWHSYSDVIAEYKFINRGETKFPPGFSKALRCQIDMMADLRFSDESMAFLERHGGYYLDEKYLNYNRVYRFDPSEVIITCDGDDTVEEVDVSAIGKWPDVFRWETHILSIMSELNNAMKGFEPEPDFEEKAYRKALLLKEAGVRWSEYGARRRASLEVQDRALSAALAGSNGNLTGTSDLYLAMKHDIAPIGTHGHELPMGLGAIHGYGKGNEEFLKLWSDDFNGHLGVALTDTYTTERFLEKFTTYYCKLFDGVRQDSGDPLVFADRIIEHYISQHVDPKTRSIVFSDSLNVEKVLKIWEYCRDKFYKVWFGIGTNISNDCGLTPLNIVMKLHRLYFEGRWHYAVKFSDVPGKVTGHPDAVRLAEGVLQLS